MPMVTLREISVDNFEECLSLSVAEDQKKHIASNAYSLAEAYALSREGLDVPLPYAIYAHGQMVGFVLTIFQPPDEQDPEDDETVFYLARMMIDRRYQGRGYGRQAMLQLLEIMKAFQDGRAEAVVLSCSPDNIAARKFYTSLGFVDSGELDGDGDIYYRLELR